MNHDVLSIISDSEPTGLTRAVGQQFADDPDIVVSCRLVPDSTDEYDIAASYPYPDFEGRSQWGFQRVKVVSTGSGLPTVTPDPVAIANHIKMQMQQPNVPDSPWHDPEGRYESERQRKQRLGL